MLQSVEQYVMNGPNLLFFEYYAVEMVSTRVEYFMEVIDFWYYIYILVSL